MAKKITKKAAKSSAKKSAAPADEAEVRAEFKKHVNMTAGQLTKWLDQKQSKKVGFKQGGVGGTGESKGHASGKKIVELLGKKQADLTAADYRHMARVVGYVKRHMAQKPEQPAGELKESRWRYSLMNWGHDPLK